MKNFFLTSLFVFSLAAAIAAQTTATPTPDSDDDDVVKISTTLIQLDVTVTDKKGNIVTDLKPEDFEVYENGVKQSVTNLSFVSNIKDAPDAKAPKLSDKTAAAAAVPVPVPPRTMRPEQVRRTMALVVDDLTLSFESVYFVRRALKKFVDEQMRDGDLVAIIRTGGGIGALQQFSSDKRQLYAAIEKVRWNPAGGGKIGAFAQIEATPLERAQSMGAQVSEEQLAAERNRERSSSDFQGSVFASGTLGALDFIVRGMQELPGRKSVMLLSDGFKLFTKDEGGFTESSRILQSLRRLTDLANRASVVVYTMDPRGLQTLGLTAADDTSGQSSDQLEQKLGDRKSELFDTQEGLIYLARQTGGFPIINNNDLSGGIRRILDDQSYYLLGYQPDAETFDPKTRRYNKLQIKVTRPGLRVRYRSGFFGVSDEQIQRPAANRTPKQQIMTALTSPFAVNGIALRLNTLFGNDAETGSYVRSLLHVNAADLQFIDAPDGTKKAVFDVLAVSFGDNGTVADQIASSYTMTVTPERYRKVMDEGFVYFFTFPVKKPGAFQLRVAIRDSQSEKVGSANQFIEVPNLKKNRLNVSGVVLENLTLEQWQKFQSGGAQVSSKANESAAVSEANPLNATALRRFKRGTILRYGTEIYNARLDAAQKPNLTVQTRMFRDGELVFEGKQSPLEFQGQTDLQRLKMMSALNLGTEMAPGDYVLQIVATDKLAKEKQRIATQFVQFEIVQ